MADGQIVFEITADGKKAIANVKDITKAIEAEGKKWDKSAEESTSSIENAFANMAKKVASYLSFAKVGKALIDFGSNAIQAASDLREVQNVVDTVFGDDAKVIDDWSKKAGEKFGLTETMAKRFTSTLGAMAKSSGIAGTEIVEMSTDLAGLAADMASFYNLDFETAFEKIRSGISGETEPLKQLGINMSVANLNAFALAQGLEKTFNEMDQGEQTMLRYQYLMQATSDAQGDFEKTSDGLANARRRVEANLQSISTNIGNLLITPFENATKKVAEFLQQISADMMPEETVLDKFQKIDVDTAEKMADLQETAREAQAAIDLLKKVEEQAVTLKDGTTISLADLFADIGEIESSGGDIRGYIEGLGLDVEKIVLEYNKWREAGRQLTSLIPSMTSVINTETGAINGGTTAVQENYREWLTTQEKKLEWAAYYAKEQALAEAKAEQYKYQYTADAKAQIKKNFEEEHEYLANLYKEKGGLIFRDYADWGIPKEDAELYMKIVKESTEAEAEATRQANAFAEAEKEQAAGKQALIEKWGEEEEAIEGVAGANKDAGNAAEEWDTKQKAAGKAAVEAADSALKALADYIQGVRDSTEQAVNSVVKGFEKVTRAGDDLRAKAYQNAKETADAEIKYASDVASLRRKFGENWMQDLQKLGEESKEWKSLSKAEQEAYNALVKLKNEQKETNDALNEYKPEGMMEGLESQKTFMENYLNDLQAAQEMGLSEDFLASLADGSKESAEYLHNLVEAGPEAAQEVSALYDEVQAQKKTFTDALADQKLAADQTYDALVQKAIEAIGELNLGAEAEAAMADTVGGLAQGIASKVGDVQAAVDSIEAQLDRLNGLGFSFSIGGFNIEFLGSLFPHFKGGTDWVPRDNYPAFLDYGEAVLTAEENKIWQMFKNGQQPTSMDYDALGGVMRDNVKAGGDVYLEGRVVGQVISGIQGRSYRNLQRSGWQG